jgi:hypothetical protein
MHLEPARDLGAEDGTSMVEVMVGLAMGMVVLAGLAMLLIVTMRGNARISARSEASDNARVAMTRIIEELHSACVQPATAPVLSGSKGTELIFNRGTAVSAVNGNQPAIETKIWYVETGGEGVLKEKSGTSPERILLSDVSPPKEGTIFEYENPTSPFATPTGALTLGTTNAAKTIVVRVAFTASPRNEPVADAGAATEIENSATLRLTPPTYRGETARPCE